MSTISPETERALLRRIGRVTGTTGKPPVLRPSGRGSSLDLAGRLFLEGVHFDLAYTTPCELGRKLAAIVLGDLGARNARPRWLRVCVGMRQETHEHFLAELFRGMKQIAIKNGVTFLPGQLVTSPSFLTVHVEGIGDRAASTKRAGVRAGDTIAVAGHLGDSAAGLNSLKRMGRENLHNWPRLVEAHLTPKCGAELARKLLARRGVTSVSVISEGLARDLAQLCEEHRIGALVREASLPISTEAQAAARLLNQNPRHWALYGGEDHVLLITMRPAAAKRICRKHRLFPIGEVLPGSARVLIESIAGKRSPLLPRNWHDFVRRAPAASG